MAVCQDEAWEEHQGAAVTPSQADATADYQEAFRLWHLAAEQEMNPDRKIDAIMRAARARQMAEDWRAEAGHWEWLGNAVGLAWDRSELSCDLSEEAKDEILRDRYRVPEGRERFAPFYVISDVEWEQPVATKLKPAALARHRQASAYEWAAARAGAAGQHDEAARLYRRSGIAWERSEHDERLRRAASCYYRAALSAARSSRYQTRRRLFDGWCPSCLRDKGREQSCGRPKHEEPLDGKFKNLGDLARLEACWQQELDNVAGDSRSTYEDADRQFGVIQHTLAAEGGRHEARRVFRMRCDFHRRYLRRRSWWRRFLSWGHMHLSWYGTSVPHTLATIAILYAVVAPILWRIFGGVPPPGDGVEHGPASAEAIILSLSSVLNLATGHFAAGGPWTTLFQSLQGISSYFALGYTLWVAQRSYAS